MPYENQNGVTVYYCGECSDTVDGEFDLRYSDYYSEECCETCYERGEEYEADERENDEDETEEYVHSYSYRPKPMFFGDDGTSSYYSTFGENGRSLLYLGMELEVEFHGHNKYERHDGAATLVNGYMDQGNPIYLKTDGSLNYGFEIVSHPGTLEYFTQHFDWSPIKALSRMGFKSWNNSHCGLHIHMTRHAFTSDKHLALFIKFIFDNRQDLVQYAGRESSYAKFGIENLLNVYYDYDQDRRVRSNKLMDIVKGYATNSDRYTAVNLQNANTIELRFFRPSLKPSTVISALEFCDASFRYTNSITLQDVLKNNALAFNSFRSWLASSQSPSYPALSERLVERLGALTADE